MHCNNISDKYLEFNSNQFVEHKLFDMSSIKFYIAFPQLHPKAATLELLLTFPKNK